jgi:hypothetical protein
MSQNKEVHQVNIVTIRFHGRSVSARTVIIGFPIDSQTKPPDQQIINSILADIHNANENEETSNGMKRNRI